MMSLAGDQIGLVGVGWRFVTQSSVLPQKPQGTSRLSGIIKNASPREDQVAPKQANKNTPALIMEWLSYMHAQIHTYPTPEPGAAVPVRH